MFGDGKHCIFTGVFDCFNEEKIFGGASGGRFHQLWIRFSCAVIGMGVNHFLFLFTGLLCPGYVNWRDAYHGAG